VVTEACLADSPVRAGGYETGDDAAQVGDRLTIVRDGKAAGTYDREGYNEAEMARAMVSQRLGDIEHIDVDEKGEGGGGLTGLWRSMFSPKR